MLQWRQCPAVCVSWYALYNAPTAMVWRETEYKLTYIPGWWYHLRVLKRNVGRQRFGRVVVRIIQKGKVPDTLQRVNCVHSTSQNWKGGRGAKEEFCLYELVQLCMCSSMKQQHACCKETYARQVLYCYYIFVYFIHPLSQHFNYIPKLCVLVPTVLS